MDKIKILLVDDHTMVREGLKLALHSKENIEIIGEASNGNQAIDMVSEVNPDIILMDINMPEIDGLTTAKEIKKVNKSIKIIILTMLENELYIIDALKNNIEGFIYKDSSVNELLNAIEQVYNGNKYFNKEVTDKILQHISNNNEKERDFSDGKTILTNRQIEIIRLIAKGLTSKVVAENLFLSELTVIKHRKNIIKKLGLKNFTEVVSYAHQVGII
jgi:DNA-binding NarL/FixJ family response regulator